MSKSSESSGQEQGLFKTFSKWCIMSCSQCDNDHYLDKLRDMLEEQCGMRVTESTIWRTLNRAGFRMKEVSDLVNGSGELINSLVDHETCHGAKRSQES